MFPVFFGYFFISPVNLSVRMSLLGYSVFSNCLRKYAIWVYVAKCFNIAILFGISPPVPAMLSKTQSDPTPLDYWIFSSNGLRKYAIWVYVAKYFNIVILFGISLQFQKWYCKFNLILFHWATAFFSKIIWRIFKNISLLFIRVPFLHKHIRLNIGPAFRLLVRQSVSPSVCQPVSPSGLP